MNARVERSQTIDTETTMTPSATPSGSAPKRGGSRARPALGAVVMALAALAAVLLPGIAQADNEIQHFAAYPSSAQAGGHPDITTEVAFGNRLNNEGPSESCNCSDGRSVTVHLPTGVIGNPHAAPVCTLANFSRAECPVGSQVGYAWVLIAEAIAAKQPLFNMETHPGEAGSLGFLVPIINGPAFIEISSRTDSDYGLDTFATGFQHLLPVDTVNIKLWGVPASPSNDDLRFPFGYGQSTEDICIGEPEVPCAAQGATSDAQEAPFLQNPTTCGVPLVASVDVLSYDGETTHAEDEWPATTGCQQLAFNPSLVAQPTTSSADSPSGLEVNLRAPQPLTAGVPSPSELKGSTVTLPAGFSINPNAADGKTACSDAAANFGTTLAANCPEASKVGTIEIDSSALPAELPGAIYLGQPMPGNKYRIFITGDGFGTHIKLAATTHLDPQTGQITLSFEEDLPQTPLQGFNFHFFGAERGLLATPTQCGSYPVQAEFEPWDSALSNQSSLSSFTVDSGPGGAPCPGAARPFSPTLEAGNSDNTAGVHSDFSLLISRADGDQNLAALDVTTPPGFSASLAGIPYCPESALTTLANPSYSGVVEQATPACPAASQIGTATAATGAGTQPLYSPGKVYLAGPYKGAPLSLEVVVPAVSGPYDLGNVVVRSAIFVNPATAQVSTVSDPITEVLDGVPLRIRKVYVNLDRPNFTLNPTNCDSSVVSAQAFGNQGAVADLAAHFQVANCAALSFSPKLGLKLRGSTKRRGHPALRAVLRTGSGEANLARTVVVMPKNELLDNSHIGTVCTKVQFAANACPADSIYGNATAFTPLLEQPLRGPVYLRSSNHKLPDLVADLQGQIDLELAGRIDSVKNGGLRARFEGIPDAPVTKFVLDMKGGSKGLLINSRSLCKAGRKASVKLIGQNGMKRSRKSKLQTSCGSKASRHKRHLRRVYRSRAVR